MKSRDQRHKVGKEIKEIFCSTPFPRCLNLLSPKIEPCPIYMDNDLCYFHMSKCNPRLILLCAFSYMPPPVGDVSKASAFSTSFSYKSWCQPELLVCSYVDHVLHR